MSDSIKDWIETTRAKALALGGERKETFKRSGGEEISPLSTAEPPPEDLGFPGEFP